MTPRSCCVADNGDIKQYSRYNEDLRQVAERTRIPAQAIEKTGRGQDCTAAAGVDGERV